MFIVELEKGVYIAEWEGDPGRTLKKENAEIFKSEPDANYKLTQARMYRPFTYAKVQLANKN